MNTNTTNNINDAVKQANRNSRALNMKAEGYYTLTYANWLTVEVFKPGNTSMVPDYMVNRADKTCTCPDAARGNYCKHQMFVEKMLENKPEAALALQEAAHMNFLCEQFDNAECATGCDYSDHF